MAFEHEPLLHAISSEALRNINSLEAMPMATLLDRRLWPECLQALESRLFPIVDAFGDRLGPDVEFWRAGGYQQLVRDFGVGNFGSLGGRRLYARLGIPLPDEDFLRRAEEHVPRLGRMMADAYAAAGAEFVRQRVVTYAEHELAAPGLPEALRGAGCHENGRTYSSRWLTPVQPPFCPFADRGTCSEFRMLAALCDSIARGDPLGAASAAGRGRFTGTLCALVSGPCCVSCVGAFAQFRRLFPGVAVSVAAGRAAGALSRQP